MLVHVPETKGNHFTQWSHVTGQQFQDHTAWLFRMAEIQNVQGRWPEINSGARLCGKPVECCFFQDKKERTGNLTCTKENIRCVSLKKCPSFSHWHHSLDQWGWNLPFHLILSITVTADIGAFLTLVFLALTQMCRRSSWWPYWKANSDSVGLGPGLQFYSSNMLPCDAY